MKRLGEFHNPDDMVDGFEASVSTWLNASGARCFEARLCRNTTIYYVGFGSTEKEALRGLLAQAAAHSRYMAGLVTQMTGIKGESI